MMNVELISYTNDPIGTIAKAASVCYDSVPSAKIVKACIKSNHLSVIEHASFTFKIEGCSRACTHQLVRHRLASYSQRSQRYCIEDDWCSCVAIPDSVIKSYHAQDYFNLMVEISKEYKNLLEDVSPEDARQVLPNACPTTIFVTMNLRSLAHFMNERLCSRAQNEIRTVATEMRNAIFNEFDSDEEVLSIFKMLLVPKCEINPVSELRFCPEGKSCGRHKSIDSILDLTTTIKGLQEEIKQKDLTIETLRATDKPIEDDEIFNISD